MVIHMKKELLAADLRQQMDELSRLMDEIDMEPGMDDTLDSLRALKRELRWMKYVA